MQGATHRAGGVTAALGGFLLSHQSGSPLIEAAPLASFLIMYPFAIWGSTASDLDHSPGSVWDEVKLAGKRGGNTIPSKDVVSRAISHTLHLTKKPRRLFKRGSTPHKVLGILDSRHRAWQTHSEFPALLLLGGLYYLQSSTVDSMSFAIYQLVLSGILMGLIAHLVLDLLTPEGLPFATGRLVNMLAGRKILPTRIKIVPHIPPAPVPPGQKPEPGFFSTGGDWEKKYVFNVIHLANILLLGYLVFTFFILPHTSFRL